jgi:hypothetical protein
MCLLVDANRLLPVVITEPSGLLPVYKQHGFLLPFSIQPTDGLSLELPLLSHTPFYQPAIDLCIDAAIPYSPPTAYEFPDQKRKRKVSEMKRLIHKFNITTNDPGLQL